jgi:hypothetical protein
VEAPEVPVQPLSPIDATATIVIAASVLPNMFMAVLRIITRLPDVLSFNGRPVSYLVRTAIGQG